MNPWSLSVTSTTLMVIGVLFMWTLELRTTQPAAVVVQPSEVDAFLAEHVRRTSDAYLPAPARVATGIEVHAIVFQGPNEVVVAGDVWQLYPDSMSNHTARGVIFPDAVPTDDDVMHESWRLRVPRGEVVGWSFRATLYEPFDYSKFPIDERDVVLRIWHVDPTQDVVLVPDFQSYDAIYPALLPGLRDGLWIPGWRLEASEFTMASANRRIGFGRPGYVGEGAFPEVAFHVRMTRDFTNAFVSNLLPLLIVALLLYGVLKTVTLDRERVHAYGFSASAALGTNTALLFAALLGHLQIRQDVSTPQILYIEYFYFIVYLLILTVSVVVFLASTPGPHSRFIREEDVQVPKLLYGPVSSGLCFAVTVWVLY